ncbi:MAG TPA: single-stranded-DNA-specific exonuclease RecJ [Bacteroidota bacterium]|nr:single-stranded-DNA-specific exonuclease RecJ [Bacteroidota bacterium]
MKPVREYRWIFPNDRAGSSDSTSASIAAQSPDSLGLIKKLTDELNISPTLAQLLVNRKIDSYEKARVFFRPDMSDLHDPFLMDGMEKAVERITRALANQETILVYGDYDVDGTNGTALLWSFFRTVGANVSYFIPDRIKDGYGLSHRGIEVAKERGATLLITVDCGVTAVEQVRAARAANIDVIICDHHEPSDTLPDAYALLDPIKPGCPYPYKALSGCGVAFKLVQALLTRPETLGLQSWLGDKADALLRSYLDLVTLATTADIVPLTEENRSLVKLGLDLINSNPRPGIRALVETSGTKPGRISAGQIVFILAPRINAVGRIGDAMRAVELLTCESYDKALSLARVFEEENRTRRKLDEEAFLEAQQIVEDFLDVEADSAIVLHQESWHPGVIGIVASRLVERYYRPTIMLTTVDGVVKGSARSISGFDIHQALKRCEDKLLQFGGHKYAAGLSVDPDRVDEFKEAFNAVAKELLTDELLTPRLNIEAEIDLDELTPKFVGTLNRFAPYGPGNMRPIFAARNVELYGPPKIVGNNHLRFKVRNNGRVFDAIGFNLGGLIERLQNGTRRVDIAFSIDEGEYAGELVPQLKIRDIK